MLSVVGLIAGLPKDLPRGSATLAERIAVGRRPTVLLALAVTLLWAMGVFSLYTFVAPFLTGAIGFQPSSVPIILFVFGEMLWVPTSQAVVAALAPTDLRGAYMGAFGGTWSVGWALTPFLGLQVREAYGDAVMWTAVATVGVLAGILGLAAARGHGEPVGSPA